MRVSAKRYGESVGFRVSESAAVAVIAMNHCARSAHKAFPSLYFHAFVSSHTWREVGSNKTGNVHIMSKGSAFVQRFFRYKNS
jgi:hypothetical protein